MIDTFYGASEVIDLGIISVLLFAPRVKQPLLRARRVHEPAAAFNVYKSRAPPLLDHLPLQSFPNTPSLGRLISSFAAEPFSYRPTPNDPFVSLSAAENLDGTAGLKPESPISNFGFDVLECLQRQSLFLRQLD